ncbi:MAG: hypothetical protein AABY22_31445, partial [Nanoarchaeota archaeon]
KIINPPVIEIPIINEISLQGKINIVIKENFPNIDFGNKDGVTILYDNIKNIEISDRTTTNTINVRNRQVQVASGLAVDALNLDCQSNNVDSMHLRGNVIQASSFQQVAESPQVFMQLQSQNRFNNIDDEKCVKFGRTKNS